MTTKAPAYPRAEELWNHIYGDGRGYLCAFSATRAEPGQKTIEDQREAYFAWPDEVWKAAQWLADQAAEGRETYQCAHLVTRWRRRKEDTAEVLALWCDIDEGQAPDTCQPSALLQSSPGRLQGWWALTRPIPWQQAERLNKRLAQLCGGDDGWHATKLLRVPNTKNHKYEDAPTVRVLYIRGDVEYDPDELERILPPLKGGTTTSAGITSTSDTSDPPVPLEGHALDWWHGRNLPTKDDGSVDESRAFWWIACALDDVHLAPWMIRMILPAWAELRGFHKYDSRPEEYDRIIGKLPERERQAEGYLKCKVTIGDEDDEEEDGGEETPLAKVQVTALMAENDRLRAEVERLQA